MDAQPIGEILIVAHEFFYLAQIKYDTWISSKQES
jgi:hypothetical protein